MPDPSSNKNIPDHLYLEVTNNCNQNCPHCSVRSWVNIPQNPDYSNLVNLITGFKALGGRHITISGGEPGLRADLPDLLSEAGELGLNPTIFTNGLAVRREVLDSLRESSGLLAISLDGHNAEVHEKLRGPESFAPTLASLEEAVSYLGGSQIIISCVLSRPVLTSLVQLWELAYVYGVAALYLGVFEPTKIHTRHPLSPGAKELIDPVLELLDFAQDKDMPRLLFSESNDLICVRSIFSSREENRILGRTVKVQPDGWAYPGPFYYDPRFRLGKPSEKGWSNVLNSPVYATLKDQAKTRIQHVKKCSQCFWAQRCGGGSLAMTWSVFRRWDMTCPLCDLYKATLGRAARKYMSNASSTIA